MKQIIAITRKELEGYFGSLLSTIFLGVFLAVVLFTFFFVEKFFARGIADVRPMFAWMPLLLVFLLAALTMRQWSEEQRSGTLEMLLTLPVKPVQLVLGKFLAVMAMIVVALLLTLPLPIMASILGNLDWGPVIGGYLAALLMAAAYAAIGLFVSSRTDNQIVALILTVLLGGLFYVVGSAQVTDFFGRSVADLLRAFGTGSRFESIERGVIDLRDLVYYLSITALFLLLNTISLDKFRWSNKQVLYRRAMAITSSLLAINLVLVNVWMYPLRGLRVDLTEQKEFTISQATRNLLGQLQEPLLIRAYISEKTHPLLEPLAPQISDMLREYEIAGNGKVTTEVLDPLSDPAIETEANQTYGISSTPFQITGANETSVINSYFSILVRYGSQSVVLNYSDLISVKQTSSGVSVSLNNLEYDLTRAAKKVIYGFQSVDSVLAALNEPVKLQFILTPDTVPQELADLQDVITQAAEKIQQDSNGKLVFETIDPTSGDSPISAQQLSDLYGVQPYQVSMLSTDTYYFNLLLVNGEEYQQIFPGLDMTDANVRTEIESAIKRTTPGFLKTVGLWVAPTNSTTDMFGQTITPLSSYNFVNQILANEYTVETVDLTTGEVPSNIEVLVVIAPMNLTDTELYAIDQYLMQGGSVIMTASNYKIGSDPYVGGLGLTPIEGGVKDLLASYGVNLSDAVVMDTQNEPFPITVTRDVGGYQVQDIQSVQYPFSEDVTTATINTQSPIMSGLSGVTMYWSSPVELDATLNAGRKTEVLMSSNPTSWATMDVNVTPDFTTYPDLGFVQGTTLQSYPLAVSIQGVFESYYKDKGKPVTATPTPDPYAASSQTVATPEASDSGNTAGLVERSPETARLVVIGSNTVADDFALKLSSRVSQDRYLNNLQLIQNAVSWAVEDEDLLSIRSRGNATHLLKTISDREALIWQMINYGIALLALVGLYVFWQVRKRNLAPIALLPARKQKDE